MANFSADVDAQALSDVHSPPMISPQKKGKNLKKLSLSTTAAKRLAPTISISTSLPSTPISTKSTNRSSPRLPLLNLERLTITHRSSLPAHDYRDEPSTPLDSTFQIMRGLQSEAPMEAFAESRDLDAYKSGPVCILPPNLWLYSEPTADTVRQFDVVINVAEEIANPLLDPQQGSIVELEPEHTSEPYTLDRFSLDQHAKHSMEVKTRVISSLHGAVEYVHMPWQHNEALSADLPVLTSLIDARIHESKRRVLVHCQQGVSRSASLVIAYIMRAKMMDVNEAYAFVKSKSPGIGPNMSLIYQLCEWGKTLQGKATQSQRRSFDVNGARTATDHTSGMRKRSISSAARGILERSQSDSGAQLPTRATLPSPDLSPTIDEGARGRRSVPGHDRLQVPDPRMGHREMG